MDIHICFHFSRLGLASLCYNSKKTWVCPNKFVSSIQDSYACVVWYPRVSIWGQIQAYTSSVIRALTGTISLRLFFIASGTASPIANILYLCVRVSLGTAPGRCQEKRRKQKQWRFSLTIGLDLEIRRNDWSLRQEGLFLSQFTPVSVHACLFRLNELFDSYEL